jgi:hypothetical protein
MVTWLQTRRRHEESGFHMQGRFPHLVWRLIAGGLLSLTLVTVTSVSAVGAQPSTANRATSQPGPAILGGRGVAPMKGRLNFLKRPLSPPAPRPTSHLSANIQIG